VTDAGETAEPGHWPNLAPPGEVTGGVRPRRPSPPGEAEGGFATVERESKHVGHHFGHGPHVADDHATDDHTTDDHTTDDHTTDDHATDDHDDYDGHT
jgi:hypothetical protein